jgi:hypothetical protein
MAGKGRGHKSQFQHSWNGAWTKCQFQHVWIEVWSIKSVSARPERGVVNIVSFDTAEKGCGQSSQLD